MAHKERRTRPEKPRKPIKTKGPKATPEPDPDPNRSGDTSVSALLWGFYRLWAAMPEDVNGIAVFVGSQCVATSRRPVTATWPIGVCRACGCSPGARCQDKHGKLCTITNDPDTPCSACEARAIKAFDPEK